MEDIKEIYAKIGFVSWILIHKDGDFIKENWNIVFGKNGRTLSNIFRYIYEGYFFTNAILNPRIKIIFKDGKIEKTNNSNYYFEKLKILSNITNM